MAAVDDFASNREGLTSPADNSIDIDAEKSDSVELSKVTRGIHCNVAGNIAGILAGDGTTSRVFVLLAGITYPYRFKQVKSTGTSATGIIGLF